MNRVIGILGVLLVITIAFAASFGYAFATKGPITMTQVRTITVSNSVYLVTMTEKVIGVITPQTATLTIIASPNCTIMIPTIYPPIIYYNKTIFILPQENASSTYSIVSTFTTFSQMSAQTTFTTITVSNAEVKTTVTSGNSTITTLTCPAYA